ncbi:hypothetical protein DDB_G0268552 [Dictyostelium discoideum AX4]|uniref:Transmembrane protein n=1 Tax=Dictyostelium discoideum TaxID=44689 RepID=Q55FT7_DICDI|nr:hypothetical protein DDB_G0268552 [Dictyostelium discoideum AX4]EAL73729.1 hypothetical protein DDB_G0268552 [Dictyostelium discoideum AX4]|eukprot:XP_647446.1 hypothetical protein DDB_G0268552 [Dictyostelium discoideum AX4]
MASTAKPNIGILIATQLVSVIGDSFGQRCSRVNYKHSTRHMMIGLCLMTAVQMFIIMGILQLSLPTSITGAIYINNAKVDCYKELDIEGKIMDCTPLNCTIIPCKSQGPFSIFRSISLHPFLLTNGLMNIIYYNGEVFLYKEPLGLLFLVISALSSTFLINPLNIIFGEPINQPIPFLIYLFGIGGSILSVIEFTPKKKKIEIEEEEEKKKLLDNNNNNINNGLGGADKQPLLLNNDDKDIEFLDESYNEGAVSSNTHFRNKQKVQSIENIDDSSSSQSSNNNNNNNNQNTEIEEKEISHQQQQQQHVIIENSINNNSETSVNSNEKSKGIEIGKIIIRAIKIFIPLVMLAIANALWMETSLFYNDQFRTNAFGYNSLDQTLLPFYLFPFMILIDFVKPLKRTFLNDSDQNESLVQAVKSTWKESNLLTLFIYRLLINGRAIMYFYLAIEYDLTMVYLESTLVRVVMNWLGAIVLNLLLPKWINATPEERKKTFHPINLILKCVGTAGVVASLIILNK